MTATDKNEVAKPLHEQIAEYIASGCIAPQSRTGALLREAAEALRNNRYNEQFCRETAEQYRKAVDALSRMRTALGRYGKHDHRCHVPIGATECACGFSVIQRALTAGSGNE